MNQEDNLAIMPWRVAAGPPQPPRRMALWLAAGKRCHWCQRDTHMGISDDASQATIDHVIPRYKGGTNAPNNVVSACRGCNARRNDEDMRASRNAGRKKPDYYQHIALTGDEKRALMARLDALPSNRIKVPVEQVMREQRDQAQREITLLRKEQKHYLATIQAQEEVVKALRRELANMTVTGLLRRKLARWIER